MRADHGLLKARAFETPATVHIVARSHRIQQRYIQANQKDRALALLINIDKHSSNLLHSSSPLVLNSVLAFCASAVHLSNPGSM